MTIDPRTLAAYTTHARGYVDEWLGQPPPVDLQDTVRRWFRSGANGGTTADIGSGGGRDVDWLNRHGYPCVGYEPNDALRAEATARFPAWSFVRAELPTLDGIASASFDNVLCETVIMHLPQSVIADAVRGLGRLLKPGGVLYLSWRVSEVDQRDARGRLYNAFDAPTILRALEPMTVLRSVEAVSASSGKRLHTVVARGA